MSSEIINNLTDKMILKIKRSNKSSRDMALETIDFLVNIIDNSSTINTRELITQIKNVSIKISKSCRNKFIVENILRRGLDIVRTFEGENVDIENTNKQGLCSLISDFEKIPGRIQSKNLKGKHEIFQEIMELKDEISISSTVLSSLSVDHIHAREIVLTRGYSELVLNFLKYAAKFRKFEVFVAEAAPNYDGRKMACDLAENDVDVTLIPDCSIFAMMARVNKVIISAHTAFASGAILAPVGTEILVQAAKYHSVTVLVPMELFKYSSKTITELSYSGENANPALTMSPNNILARVVKVDSPLFDIVAPDYTSLFVTSSGGLATGSIHRLSDELYSREDRDV